MNNSFQQSQITHRGMNGELIDILKKSQDIARSYGVTYVGSEFILFAITKTESRCKRILLSFGITEDVLRPIIVSGVDRTLKIQGFTANVKKIAEFAKNLANEYNCYYLTTEHFLLSILNNLCEAQNIISSRVVDFSALVKAVKKCVEDLSANKPTPSAVVQNPAISNNVNKTYTQGLENIPSIKGTILESFGYDLTEKARREKLDPVIGRDREINQIINTLSRRQKNNPLVIGEPGTGKTAVVEGLAQKIISGEVPYPLKNKILFSLDLTSIIAGAKMRGEFEQRFKEMIEYIQENGNIILFIDEIHNLVSGAKSDGVNASEILKPALARGELQLVGATTVNEYRKYIEKDPALERRFQPIMIDPPSVDDTITIIKGLKDTFELHHRIEITDEAIVAAATLSDRYITDRFLPDKAIDLIDEAAARARIIADMPDQTIIDKENEFKRIDIEIDYARRTGVDFQELQNRQTKLSNELDTLYESSEKLKSRTRPFIDGDDIAKVISDLTKIPVARLTETEADKLLKLEDTLHKRVIGQDQAVKAVSKAIKRAMTGVQDPKRPIGTFLFAGPTGVGKTELSKALAETLFGDEDMLIRIDMSEYMEPNSVAKLIGAPPGYVGYDEEGQLTEKVRRKPYSVVLFDEVEKAHRDVFNLFLQIFDDGRLTDSKGRLVDFKNTVIIMTSNVGAGKLAEKTTSIGFGSNVQSETTSARENLMVALKHVFKLEFINRIDEIVQFSSLSKADCSKICRILIDNFKVRLAQKNIIFSYTDEVVSLIVNKGYNSEFGARPLKRAIINMLEDEVSERMLMGKIKEGSIVNAFDYGGFIDFEIS